MPWRFAFPRLHDTVQPIMPTALLTDLHANREALEACLEHTHRVGATRFAITGDLVGYGADPSWVVQTVMRMVADGAVVVRGNHDEAAVHGAPGRMRAVAAEAIDWTRTQLSDAERLFLAELPLTAQLDDILLVHANAWDPGGWEYVEGAFEAGRSLQACTQWLTVCGHVHEPALYRTAPGTRTVGFAPVPAVPIPLSAQRRWLAIPGSVGQPRDGVAAACWALFDERDATLTFHRVPYDVEAAARKVRAAGLPESLAVRLENGW